MANFGTIINIQMGIQCMILLNIEYWTLYLLILFYDFEIISNLFTIYSKIKHFGHTIHFYDESVNLKSLM